MTYLIESDLILWNFQLVEDRVTWISDKELFCMEGNSICMFTQ